MHEYYADTVQIQAHGVGISTRAPRRRNQADRIRKLAVSDLSLGRLNKNDSFKKHNTVSIFNSQKYKNQLKAE